MGAPMRPKRGHQKRLVDSRTVRHTTAECAAEGIYFLVIKCCCRLDNCLNRKCEVARVMLKPLLDLIRLHLGEAVATTRLRPSAHMAVSPRTCTIPARPLAMSASPEPRAAMMFKGPVVNAVMALRAASSALSRRFK